MSTDLIPAGDGTGESRSLATRKEEHQLLTQLFGDSGAALHNFPPDPQEQFYLTSDALGDDCTSGDEWDGVFPIVYWYVHSVTLQREDGEWVTCLRTVLMDGKGHKLKFVSDGVAADIRRIVQCFGMRPYDPPVCVRVATVKTGKGRRLTRLMPVRPESQRTGPAAK